MKHTNTKKKASQQDCFNTDIKDKTYFYQYPTSLGDITITCTQDAITAIYLGNPTETTGENSRTAIMDQAYQQIQEYLSGNRKIFDIPLSPKGTAFQQKVWKALCTIPYGETRSYSEIAEMVGNPKACRAVGMANNRNPIIILIPCHRVIGKNGNLVGYACGLEIKEYLLNLEGYPIK